LKPRLGGLRATMSAVADQVPISYPGIGQRECAGRYEDALRGNGGADPTRDGGFCGPLAPQPRFQPPALLRPPGTAVRTYPSTTRPPWLILGIKHLPDSVTSPQRRMDVTLLLANWLRGGRGKRALFDIRHHAGAAFFEVPHIALFGVVDRDAARRA
jgi:hypothetical protein